MTSNGVAKLIFPCFTLIFASYGIWHVFYEALFSMLPFGMMWAFWLSFVVYFLRAPAPDPAAVEAIVGKDPWDDLGNSPYSMKTVAHRGAGMDAPENSLVAFQMCKDKGCNAIEFDVTLTSDYVPIVFHDDTLDRMAGISGIVNQQTWSELQNIDISVNHAFRERFTKTGIPTLEDSVKQMLMSGQHMFIDIKYNNRKMVDVILNLYEAIPELHSSAVVTSFFPNLIYLIRKKNPKIVCSLAWRPYVFSLQSFNLSTGFGPPRSKNWLMHCYLLLCDYLHEWCLSNITYYFLGLSIILLHKDAISGNTVLNWRSKGVRVIAWTVNSPIEKQHCAKNLKITYMTDTLTGESSTHLLNPPGNSS